ncbi:MAG TPA: Arm DNA-binding domain-containing protein [Hyphomonadaceae bacterium]|nr:Arm DNA-binding domain-containing protein [Hyphomonadaceae bacterium]
MGYDFVSLNDVQIRALRPRAKPYKVHDGDGLFVHVPTSGKRIFRMKYVIEGRERLMTFGRFPATKLGDARRLRKEARDALDEGRDPAFEKQQKKRATRSAVLVAQKANFHSASKDWYAAMRPKWRESHADNVWSRIDA